MVSLTCVREAATLFLPKRVEDAAVSALAASVGKIAASVLMVRVVETAAFASEAWVEEASPSVSAGRIEEALLYVALMAEVANLKLDLIEDATASLDDHCSRSTSALG